MSSPADQELPEFVDPEPTQVLLLVARAALWPLSGTRKARRRDLVKVMETDGLRVVPIAELRRIRTCVDIGQYAEAGERLDALIGDSE